MKIFHTFIDTANKDCLEYILRTMKNDFEVLRGPVRVYIKLKKQLGNEKRELISKFGAYEIYINDICDGKEGTAGPFSKVYDGSSNEDNDENAKFMFNDSVKTTIDNMLGVNNTTIMAYGPSGSGKTFNLIEGKIQRKKVNGIIKLSLDYLLSKKENEERREKGMPIVKSVEISSRQYYNTCRKSKKINAPIIFDSLISNVDLDLLQDVQDVQDVESCILNPLCDINDIPIKHYYKYEQSHPRYMISMNNFNDIEANIFDEENWNGKIIDSWNSNKDDRLF